MSGARSAQTPRERGGKPNRSTIKGARRDAPRVIPSRWSAARSSTQRTSRWRNTKASRSTRREEAIVMLKGLTSRNGPQIQASSSPGVRFCPELHEAPLFFLDTKRLQFALLNKTKWKNLPGLLEQVYVSLLTVSSWVIVNERAYVNQQSLLHGADRDSLALTV
ncbi:hypothetical protein KP509_04G046100 [Ceratopteris richardii]|uniref:Uncharacterized protein n=1 Tax=Ceratopteris richardii TaxID=49495 RepID=A0A8T2V051_CERRI|nr:hypothetical protein KP509_04G046100 [Ceratopteris richardii]